MRLLGLPSSPTAATLTAVGSLTSALNRFVQPLLELDNRVGVAFGFRQFAFAVIFADIVQIHDFSSLGLTESYSVFSDGLKGIV